MFTFFRLIASRVKHMWLKIIHSVVHILTRSELSILAIYIIFGIFHFASKIMKIIYENYSFIDWSYKKYYLIQEEKLFLNTLNKLKNKNDYLRKIRSFSSCYFLSVFTTMLQYTHLGTKGTGHWDTREKICFKTTLLLLQQILHV